MRSVKILRQRTSSEGTFGILTVFEDSSPLLSLFTGELPWRDNLPKKSCIPKGKYECQPWNSKKYPNTYNVMDVPGRTAILIHAGNFCGNRDEGFLSNVEGCILVGTKFGSISGQQAVLSSKIAMSRLRNVLGSNFFELSVEGIV